MFIYHFFWFHTTKYQPSSVTDDGDDHDDDGDYDDGDDDYDDDDDGDGDDDGDDDGDYDDGDDGDGDNDGDDGDYGDGDYGDDDDDGDDGDNDGDDDDDGDDGDYGDDDDDDGDDDNDGDDDVTDDYSYLFSFSFCSSLSFNMRVHSSGHLYPFNCWLRDNTRDAGSPGVMMYQNALIYTLKHWSKKPKHSNYLEWLKSASKTCQNSGKDKQINSVYVFSSQLEATKADSEIKVRCWNLTLYNCSLFLFTAIILLRLFNTLP